MTMKSTLTSTAAVAAFGALLAAASPAHAMPAEQLSCAIDKVSEKQAGAIFDLMASGVGDAVPMAEEVFACVDQFAIPESAEEAFYWYSVASVSRDEARRRLVANELRMGQIDTYFDVGIGRTNPIMSNFTETQWEFIEGFFADRYPDGNYPEEVVGTLAGYLTFSQQADLAFQQLP